MSEIRHKVETAVKRCYSTWGESYYGDYYGPDAPYPPVHSQLLRDLLLEHRTKKLLDAGCGPASFLRDLADTDMILYGFDLTPEMIASGKEVFASLSIPRENLWEGSVLDPSAYGKLSGSYDAAVCVGVMPHIAPEDDAVVVHNLKECVRPGGLVAVEARNALFSLFTLNRYTYDFIKNHLIKPEELAAYNQSKELDSAMKEMEELVRMDLPPIRKGKKDEPGYDEVLSRTHVPFELKNKFETEGLQNVKILFYHYHCMPPMFQAKMPELFVKGSIGMENPEDWRGYFMASAFIVTGIRA